MPVPNTSSEPTTANVWLQMNYVVPRGRCNHKPSLLTSSCPCLRFMAHPLHAATSFECDGCGHHASFHMLVNKEEDELVERWRAVALREEERMAEKEAEMMEREKNGSGKRKRVGKKVPLAIADGGGGRAVPGDERVVEVDSDSEAEVVLGRVVRKRRAGRGP